MVLDAAPSPGGKLRTSPFAGVALDEAADAFLARVPEAVELCAELDVTADLVSPATGAAHVYLDGALRRLPADQLLGVPTDLDAAGRVRPRLRRGRGPGPPRPHRARRPPARRHRRERRRPRPPAAGRRGARPAGRPAGRQHLRRRLRPAVAAGGGGAARRGPGSRPRRPQPGAGGSGDAGRGRPDRPTGVPRPRGRHGPARRARWRSASATTCGPPPPCPACAGDGQRWWRSRRPTWSADRVVVATPAFAAAPAAGAARPRRRGLSSPGSITPPSPWWRWRCPATAIDRALDGSGFLVARSAGLLTTACSWVTSKWPHLAADPDVVLLRASVGRDGDERALALDDDALVAGVLDDLATTMGLRAPPRRGAGLALAAVVPPAAPRPPVPRRRRRGRPGGRAPAGARRGVDGRRGRAGLHPQRAGRRPAGARA